MHGSRIWLERQPAPGIWAGLYSLPRLVDDASDECNITDAVAQWLAHRAWAPKTLPDSQPVLSRRFKHAFTHFKLDAQVWRLELKCAPLLANEPGRGFYSEQELAQLGLPKPIQTLLKDLFVF